MCNVIFWKIVFKRLIMNISINFTNNMKNKNYNLLLKETKFKMQILFVNFSDFFIQIIIYYEL